MNSCPIGADTTGAVYGQIAGAVYGYDGIPKRWRSVVAQADVILDMADRLAAPTCSRKGNDLQG